jgi:hypothetical protein
MTPQMQNRFARPNPPAFLHQFSDVHETLVFDYQIQPNAQIVGLQQPISMEGDFYLFAWQASSVIQLRPDNQEDAGNVSVRLADDTGYRLSNDYIGMNFLTSISGNPWPFVLRTPHMFRAGTKIWIDMQENSGYLSNVQVAFLGQYRFRGGQ